MDREGTDDGHLGNKLPYAPCSHSGIQSWQLLCHVARQVILGVSYVQEI